MIVGKLLPTLCQFRMTLCQFVDLCRQLADLKTELLIPLGQLLPRSFDRLVARPIAAEPPPVRRGCFPACC